ncbi:hypothetical protein [Burkholderia latens]|uniref:hypothetical protein n=1 Tax=Burkholderia latens TaxID=488446 RepID=UPI00158A9971|nr:hypothetical protein [Burkholderia latens]
MGDFDIDPHLADQLLSALVTSGQCSASDWTHDFADGHSGDSGTLARLYEEGRNNLVGPGSIIGNLTTPGSAPPMRRMRYPSKETSTRARRR